MKVLQLIDSLDAGGAERMAVNLANELSSVIETSYLCATRKEGILKEDIHADVKYSFLNRKRTLDFKALLKLREIVKHDNIDIVHAHATSFFMAFLLKLVYSPVKIIWHDHYGNSEFLSNRPKQLLKLCSSVFSHVFVVNDGLKIWAKRVLKVKRTAVLNNFVTLNKNKKITRLNGIEGKRIVCLANLRVQKNHKMLFEAFETLDEEGWSLHVVGKNFKDAYASDLKHLVASSNLSEKVFFYDSCPDVGNILTQSNIGVLSSDSEGLPLAILEYGLANLAVVSTNVGDINKVITHEVNGLIVEAGDVSKFKQGLKAMINNLKGRSEFGIALHQKVTTNFAFKSIQQKLLKTYAEVINE